jgi:hypothetical protein
MRLSHFFFLLAFALAASPAQAGASPACGSGTTSGCTLVGTACSSLGQTKMDYDQKGIVSCVCSTTSNCGDGSADLKWAAMGGGLGRSCPQQQVVHAGSGQACAYDGSRCGYYKNRYGYANPNYCCWTTYTDSTVGPSPDQTITSVTYNSTLIFISCDNGTWMCASAGATSTVSTITGTMGYKGMSDVPGPANIFFGSAGVCPQY